MADRKKENAVVVSQEQIAEGIFSMWLNTEAAKAAKKAEKAARKEQKLSKGERRSLIFMLGGLFFLFCGTNAITTFFALFAAEELGKSTGEATIMTTLFAVCSAAAAIPAGKMGKKLGRKKTILAGVLIPTFGGIIDRANESAEMQKVAAAYKEAYALAMADDGKIDLDDYNARQDGETVTETLTPPQTEDEE